MIKVSVIVLVGLLAAALLRRQSAALRHWVLASAIGCAAAMPVLQVVVPAWQVPVRVFGRQGGATAAARAVPVAWLLEDAATRARPGSAGAPQAPLPLLGWIWVGGAVITFSLLLVGFGRVAWVARRSRQVVDGTWSEVAFALAEPGRKRRPVRLLQSDHPLLLVTWGLTRPRVILPRTAGDWPADRVRAVLGHELAHVERRDWAVQMVAELLRCIYWFNPLLWVACRRLRQESEQACDDAVLSMGVDARDYATHLLDVARALGHSHARRALFPAPAMARRSYLERRVRAMLNTRLNRTPLPRTAGIAIVVGLFAVTVPIAGVIASADLPRPAEAQPLVGATTRSRPADQVARADRRAPAFTSSRTTAQNAPAACSGTLMDATGRAMPGVPLALVNAGTGQRHEARSDEVGHFAISGLAAGEYQVEVQKAGFTRTQGRIVLAAGQELRQDVVAQIGSLMEMVVVQGGGPGTPDARPAVPRPLVLPGAPDADPCAQSVAGGCLTPPRKLVDANPVFPRAHAQDGASGTVVVEGRVGTDGFLKDLRVNDGADPDFAAATVEAVRQWQYAPVRLNGIPQECRLTVTVQFHSGSI